MQSVYLSERERCRGRKFMARFEVFNGISYGLLGETLVYILAVRFNASNLALGFIPTVIYVTFLVIPFLMRFMNGRNLGKVMAVAWYARGIAGIGYVTLLFLDGNAAVALLLSVYIAYALFRSIGIISYDPIAKSVTTLHNRGTFYSALNFTYNFTLLFAKLLSSATTAVTESILAIVALQMIGVVANMFSSYYGGRIPCRMLFTYSKGESYFSVFRGMMRSAKIRNRVFLKWIYLAVKMFMSMAIPYMSVKLHLSAGLVIMYSVVVSVAYLCGGYISRTLGDKVGARPLLQIFAFVSLVSCVFFILAPGYLSFWPFFIMGFIFNVSVQVCELQSGSLVVGVIPEKSPGGFNLVVNIVMGIIALLSGFASGELVDVGEYLALSGKLFVFNDYSLCFAGGAFLSLFGLVYSVTLREKGAKTAREVMSFRNLQAVSEFSALENSTDSFYRRRHVMYLGENSSEIVADEIRRKLHSPYSRDLRDLLQVIGEKKRGIYLPDVMAIAANDNNYMQVTAIETLSNFNGDAAAMDCLVGIFRNSRWISARTAAVRALSHYDGIGFLYDEIEKIAGSAEHIEVCVDCLIAEYHADGEKRLFSSIFAENFLKKTREFRQTRYCCFDALLLSSDALSRLARIYEKLNRGFPMPAVLSSFLDDNRNIPAIDDGFSLIPELIGQKKYDEFYTFCSSLLSSATMSSRKDLSVLKESVPALFGVRSADESDLVACLYFSVLAVSLSSEDGRDAEG